MKKKLLTLLTALLIATTLTACSNSKNDSSTTETAASTESASEVTSTTDTSTSTETENSDDFIAMAKEMYLQYNDDEKYFDQLLYGYNHRFSSNDYCRIVDSSYSYAYYGVDLGTGMNSWWMDASSYACDRNGRKLQEFASELANNVNAITDVVVKNINGLNIAHFTAETEGLEEGKDATSFYYDEVYVVDDIKDDKFLVVVYKYYNKKKINDNSKNPSVMTSDRSEYFLITALGIQKIRENELFEVEAYDFDENVSSNIAFNIYAYHDYDLYTTYYNYFNSESYVNLFERNEPIEGSDEYVTTKGFGAKEFMNDNSIIGQANLSYRLFGDYGYVYYFDTLKIDSDIYNEERDSLSSEYSCEEVNINGLNGLLYSGEDGYKIYWFENNGYAVEIIFTYDTCEYDEFNNSIEDEFSRFLNSIHIVER